MLGAPPPPRPATPTRPAPSFRNPAARRTGPAAQDSALLPSPGRPLERQLVDRIPQAAEVVMIGEASHGTGALSSRPPCRLRCASPPACRPLLHPPQPAAAHASLPLPLQLQRTFTACAPTSPSCSSRSAASARVRAAHQGQCPGAERGRPADGMCEPQAAGLMPSRHARLACAVITESDFPDSFRVNQYVRLVFFFCVERGLAARRGGASWRPVCACL